MKKEGSSLSAIFWILIFFALLMFPIFGVYRLGILKSLLIAAVPTALLIAYFKIRKNVLENVVTWDAVKFANKLPKIYNYVSVTFCVIGILLFLGGFFVGEKFSSNEVCTVCGGDGMFYGKACGNCSSGTEENFGIVLPDFSWAGILIVTAGVVMLFVVNSHDSAIVKNVYASDNKKVAKYSENPADLTVSFGHWKENEVSKKIWISNKPDTAGKWTINCQIRYKSSKPANEMLFSVVAYDCNGVALSTNENFRTSKIIFNKGQSYSVGWKNLWESKNIASVKLVKVEVRHTDGTVSNISNP